MADKELEIKLRATGGDAAASEVEKVVEATESLNTEVAKTSEMTPMFDWGAPIEEGRQAMTDATTAVEDLGATVMETAPALDGLTEAIDTSSKSTGGFGARLLTLAGGPIGIATTAITGIAALYQFLKRRIDDVVGSSRDFQDANRQTSDRLAEMASPLDQATQAILDHDAAMSKIVESTDVAVTAIGKRTDAAKSQREAAADLRDALLDLQEAEGTITKEERVKVSSQNEAADIQAERTAALEAAQTKAAEVSAAMQSALVEVTAAQVKLVEIETATKNSRAEADAASQANRSAAARKDTQIGAVASGQRTLVESIGNAGLVGGTIDFFIEQKVIGDQLEKLQEERDKLQVAADAILEGEEKNAEKSAPEIDAARKALESARTALEAIRKLQSEVGSQVVDAERQKQIAEEFQIPTVQARAQAELAKMQAEQKRRDDAARQKAEAEAARAASDAQAAAASEAANAAARETAAQAARMAGNAAANGGVPASVVGAVENAAAKLSDGTTEQEIAGVMGRIVTALEGVPAAQQSAMRAALDPLMSRLEQVESQIRNGTRK